VLRGDQLLPAASRSTPCCRAARRNAATIWRWR
jgi:hypothetical protein